MADASSANGRIGAGRGRRAAARRSGISAQGIAPAFFPPHGHPSARARRLERGRGRTEDHPRRAGRRSTASAPTGGADIPTAGSATWRRGRGDGERPARALRTFAAVLLPAQQLPRQRRSDEERQVEIHLSARSPSRGTSPSPRASRRCCSRATPGSSASFRRSRPSWAGRLVRFAPGRGRFPRLGHAQEPVRSWKSGSVRKRAGGSGSRILSRTEPTRPPASMKDGSTMPARSSKPICGPATRSDFGQSDRRRENPRPQPNSPDRAGRSAGTCRSRATGPGSGTGCRSG